MQHHWILSVVLCVVLSGCGDTLNGTKIAEEEVARFHDRMKAKEFDAIYDTSGKDFQSAVAKPQALALFEAIDRKLGPLTGQRQLDWSIKTYNLVTTVRLVYESKFKGGTGTETFVFRVNNKTAELVGYNMSSVDMMIK